MKLNLLALLMLFSIVGCKKDEYSKEGEWSLKNYSVIYYDQTGNKIFESKPEELLQFNYVSIKGDTISLFNYLYKNLSVESSVKEDAALILYMNVKKSGNSAQLNFGTIKETNTDRWEIYRSTNGKNYSLITTIKAAGSSDTTHNYNFIDLSPPLGYNYYYLKLFDLDGSFQNSGIVTIPMDFHFSEINGNINLPVDLIDHTFKKVEITFVDNKMIWKDEVENTLYFENGVPKSAAKAKLQLEFDRN